MIIILIVVGLVLISFCVYIFTQEDDLGGATTTIFILFSIVLIVMSVRRYGTGQEAINFVATQLTIEEMRDNRNLLEQTGVGSKIIEANTWLLVAKIKRQNPWVNWFWSPMIDKLELIKIGKAEKE